MIGRTGGQTGGETGGGTIGQRVRRKEDPRLLLGGRYIADLARPGMLHAAFVRSPHAHARIVSVEVPPGVTAFSHADIGADMTPIPVRLGPKPAFAPFLQLPLAPGEVRYVGEPVVVAVASSRYEAEDACERIRVVYEPLEPAQALFDTFTVDVGDVEAAFRRADVVVRATFKTNRHAGSPLETRGLLAEWDGDEMTVWGPTKVTHFNRGVLATMLRLPESRVRFIEPDVGGGFGTKGEFYPEDFLIPYLARRLGKPVRWIEDRGEHLCAANHSREQTHEVELAARADGRVLAVRGRLDCDMGAYVRTHGVIVPELTSALLLGPYDVPNYHYAVRCLRTNKTPTGTYRGPGRFEGGFVRERLLDKLAAKLSLDPSVVRRRNLIRADQIPYDRGTAALDGIHTTLDSGDYPALFERALERFGYRELRAQQRAPRAGGSRLGIGMACFCEKTGPGPWEAARVSVQPDGEVIVHSGGASLGQGMETVLAQICAEHLDVAYTAVRVRHGDTAEVPFGIGSWGSRQTTVGGCAVAQAAAEVRGRALQAAARVLEARPEDLEWHRGRVRVAGTGRAVSLAEIATACAPPHGDGLAADAVYRTARMSYPFGVHLAAVDVDGETGRTQLVRYLVAYDVGRAVNPTLVEGQMVGGAAQGIGGVLLEEFVYGPAGQFQSGTFMDYLLPTSMEVPRVETLIDEVPTDVNPLGVKGAGEGGLVGAPGAIANAVADAAGAEVDTLPLTPERICALFSGFGEGPRAAGGE